MKQKHFFLEKNNISKWPTKKKAIFPKLKIKDKFWGVLFGPSLSRINYEQLGKKVL